MLAKRFESYHYAFMAPELASARQEAGGHGRPMLTSISCSNMIRLRTRVTLTASKPGIIPEKALGTQRLRSLIVAHHDSQRPMQGVVPRGCTYMPGVIQRDEACGQADKTSQPVI